MSSDLIVACNVLFVIYIGVGVICSDLVIIYSTLVIIRMLWSVIAVIVTGDTMHVLSYRHVRAGQPYRELGCPENNHE